MVKTFVRPNLRGHVLFRSAVRVIRRRRDCPYCNAILCGYNPGEACRPCQAKLRRGVVLQRIKRTVINAR